MAGRDDEKYLFCGPGGTEAYCIYIPRKRKKGEKGD
jgi:hypothetical protein